MIAFSESSTALLCDVHLSLLPAHRYTSNNSPMPVRLLGSNTSCVTKRIHFQIRISLLITNCQARGCPPTTIDLHESEQRFAFYMLQRFLWHFDRFCTFWKKHDRGRRRTRVGKWMPSGTPECTSTSVVLSSANHSIRVSCRNTRVRIGVFGGIIRTRSLHVSPQGSDDQRN
jgi:hypothetical protein